MSEIITSRNNIKIKEAFYYKNNKADYFLVEGFHMVEMAINHGLAVSVFSLKPYQSNVKNYLVNESIIAKLTNSKSPEGIVAICKKKIEAPISNKRIIILDAVADPGNVGTICRSALAFGFTDVILGKNCASIYNYKTLMASQGAIFALNIINSKNLDDDISFLKKNNYQIYGTSLKNAANLNDIDTKIDKLAIILGNEGNGVNPKLLELTDKNIKIEMDNIDSLNVAMAGAILMYNFRKIS